MNWKKMSTLLLASALSASLFSGCGGSNTNTNTLKTGVGIVTQLEGANADEDNNGKAETTFTVCAVTLDANQKIQQVRWDTIESGIAFAADGTLVTDLSSSLRSKREQGNDYGMRGASPIGKEWYEQVNALESYAAGKTVEEVINMPLTSNTVPDVTVLKTTCTIKCGPFLEALQKAADNAR